MRLSVLDQSPVSQGSTGPQALANSVDLARLAEELGYVRYWVAEHHATSMLASPAPEVLIAAIGAATTEIRVGSGGVMLPHYSPLKVAEVFSMLAGLFGDRVDLGIGRAPGTDPQTMFALQRDRRQRSPDDFPEQLAELLAYLDDDFPDAHPFARLAALPGLPARPAPWLLGSSPQSAIWAAELGLPYSFADFINPAGAEIAALYRERFVPSADLAAPRISVAVSAICAETDEEAELLASSSRMAIVQLRRGRPGAVPPVEDVVKAALIGVTERRNLLAVALQGEQVYRLGRVIIPNLVVNFLKMPAPLARGRIERHNRRCEQVFAGALRSVFVRPRV